MFHTCKPSWSRLSSETEKFLKKGINVQGHLDTYASYRVASSEAESGETVRTPTVAGLFMGKWQIEIGSY